MRKIFTVILICVAAFVISSLAATCARGQEYLGSYDMDPQYWDDNGKHSPNFILLTNSPRGDGKSRFANFSIPGENHIPHDHYFTVVNHDLVIYCYQNRIDNTVQLIKRVYGFFDNTYKYIFIDGNVYVKVSEDTGFPGCPNPTGKK